MVQTGGPRPTACALEGCEAPVVQRPGGGRPRLYCSDAHRAEARRRRLAFHAATLAGTPGLTLDGGLDGGPGGGAAAAGGGPRTLDDVRALLSQALTGLQRAEAAAPRDDARVAAIRAEATGEVLRAQQAAADAAREAAGVRERLTREREEWRERLDLLAAEHAAQSRLVEELSGALDGARAELEQELLRHHADVERAEAFLEALRATHASEMDDTATELDLLRDRLAVAAAAADHAVERAGRAEQMLAERHDAATEHEVRAARAEEQSRQAGLRLDEARAELARLRRELTGERRHHRAIEAEPRRRVGRPSPAAPATR